MGLGCVAHIHDLMNLRGDGAVVKHWPDGVLCGVDDASLVSEIAVAQAGGGDGAALAQQAADVELALNASLHADDDQVAVLRQGLDVSVEVLCAHDVQNDVGATLSCNDLLEVLFLVIDEDVGAELLALSQLLRRTGGDCDASTEPLGHLNSESADATRATVDQQ